MSSKVKLLFDVEKLCIEGTKGTGIVRVCDELINIMSKDDKIDLYLLVPTRHGNIDDFLRLKGWEARFKNKIVYMQKLKATTKFKGFYQKLRAYILARILEPKYTKILQRYNAYFSPFAPISPIVYKSGLKTFMIIHDLIPIYYGDGCNKNYIKKFTAGIKASHPDAYFCDSEYTTKDLIKFKPEAANTPMYTLYLGADSEKFKPVVDVAEIDRVKEKYNIKTKKYFLAVSEITARKNLVHLLSAFETFLQDTKADDISLVLVGPVRKGYDDVAKQVKGLEVIKDKIIQTGFADNEDLAPLYSGATGFIYPSMYEGFGLPILEAMQCGTPVITCNNTSLPEVGGDAVLYINGKDKNETAMLLNKLYQDEDLCNTLKKKGLEQSKKFNWQNTADVVINAVVNIVKGEKNG